MQEHNSSGLSGKCHGISLYLIGMYAAAAMMPWENADAEIYSCMCDMNPEAPVFSIKADKSEYLLELSLFNDFSFSTSTYVTVGSSGTADTSIDSDDYVQGTYYWRYRRCGYSAVHASYPTNPEQKTITFGTRDASYTKQTDGTDYTDIKMPDGSTYTLSSAWVRSYETDNHWSLKSPERWVINDEDAEQTGESAAHGVVIRNNIIYTPHGGDKFNSAWIVDGGGLGLNRMRLSDGQSLPPLRIIAPEDHPFRNESDGAYAGAMYSISEDNDGLVYFSTTTDMINNNIATPLAIRIYSLDLSSVVEQDITTSQTITADFVEELPFPMGTPSHSRHHQVAISGSLKGQHYVWTAGYNGGCDADLKEPEVSVVRWSINKSGTQPIAEIATLKDMHIGGYNPKVDYITAIIQQITPADTPDTFYFHSTYYDNGMDPIVYYCTAPTLCRFIPSGECEIISDLSASSSCHNEGVAAAIPAGLSRLSVDGNRMIAYGSVNERGLSTISLATLNGDLSSAIHVATLNPTGFSYRHRQSVSAKLLPGHLLVYAGNGGMALYRFHNKTSAGIEDITDNQIPTETKYFTIDGLQLNNEPESGFYIRKDIMPDGTIRMLKVSN